MKYTALVLVAPLGLSACSGSKAQLDMMRSHSELRVERPTGLAYDRNVIVKNAWDFTYDTSDKAAREDIARRGIAGECPSARIVSEEFIRTDARPNAGEWHIHMRCAG